MDKLLNLWNRITGILDRMGEFLPQLGLRLLLAWEFYDSGVTKFHGENWFADIKDQFPFPFDVIPVNISWQMSTWFEIIGGIALAIGLATRFFAVSLLILTVVAIYAVHWPAEWHSLSELWRGYAISDQGYGNYKLPLIFIIMLLPLIFSGPGKASIDYWLARRLGARAQ